MEDIIPNEQTLREGEGQGGLACCSAWGRKELDTPEQTNYTILNEDEE